MITITKGELYVVRDALEAVLEDEDYDVDEVHEALDIINSLLYEEIPSNEDSSS